MRWKRLFGLSSKTKKKLSAVFFIFLLVFGGFMATGYLRVSQIIVLSENRKIKLIGVSDLQDKNLLFLDSGQAQREIMAKNASVKSLRITKIFPDKIQLEVTVDRPVAVVLADGGYLYLSDQAKIISKNKNSVAGLPRINYYQKIYFRTWQAGQKLDYKEITTVLKLLKKTAALGLLVDSVDIAGTYMVAFNLDQKKIIFSLDKDLGQQEYQLETIVKMFKIEGKEFTSLDLRFTKPVMKVK